MGHRTPPRTVCSCPGTSRPCSPLGAPRNRNLWMMYAYTVQLRAERSARSGSSERIPPFRLYESWKVWAPNGRPATSRELRDLVRRISVGELLPASFEVDNLATIWQR
jgi:hypothetical protein